jgi:uncharacterized 2Fe-2S/4Fe-4S cluster protein (DUF4445 family)
MAPNTKKDALVVFSPSGKRGRFPIGTPVLQAARSLGVDIDSVCGGRAMCGRCQVTVTEGALVKHGIVSALDNLSSPDETERRFAEQQRLNAGHRLSCRARIEGDLAVDVPATSQVHRQVIRKAGEAHDIEINPVVQPYFIEVAPPDLHRPDGDLQRVYAALHEQWQLEGLCCDLPAQQRLQSALHDGNWEITVAVRNDEQIVAAWPGLRDRLFGIAVDVGSTTVAAHLCNLRNGDLLKSAGRMNPQIRFGEDLMSRVSFVMAHPELESELTGEIRRAINGLVCEVSDAVGIDSDEIVEMTIVGNPIMHHLLLGISPVELGRAPFTLANNASINVRASEIAIAINPGAFAYVLPCIAGHVGADAAGVLLAEAPYERDDISLIVDVGTNAEILLGNRDRLLAASSPTGPAFEGAQISSGQRAAPGAIERVRIDRESLEPRFKVIGCELWSNDPQFQGQLPSGGVTGICGTGIIEAIAEMYLAGIVNPKGRVVGAYADRSKRIVQEGRTFSYVLYDRGQRICIRQSDVRAIQLAKASMYAGAKLLMEEFGTDQVDRIRLAGAFGSQIDAKYALVLGMIPDAPLDSVSSAGNAAGTGARIALLDRNSRSMIEEQVRAVEKIETAVAEDFQEQFVAAMAIPHASNGNLKFGKDIDNAKLLTESTPKASS